MSWRFVRTPKWIVRHVAVALLCAAMVGAMLWQISRLHEKQDFARLVEARQDEPAAPVDDLVPLGTSEDAIGRVAYRAATAEGRYLDDQTVVVENRSLNGAPGAWVLTPLELAPGEAVLVNRGFIGFTRKGEIVAPPAPAGVVAVQGLVLEGQHRGSFGARDPEEGKLAVLARVDLERIDGQVPERLLPAYLQRVSSSPDEPPVAEGDPQLVPLDPPDVGEGPHLSYAVQWAIFTTIAAGGYVLLLRRVAKDQAREQAREAGSAPLV